jgi:protein-S-isoprenylcysteine O-methyltransferase Ste14
VRHPFRRKNLSARLWPLYALAVAVFALADPTPLGALVGAALLAAGVALRAWGAGHLVKNDRLTVTGPYAYLRHPLYAGTLLLGLGFGALAGGAALLLVVCTFVPVFFAYYLPYKERIEAARLERRYGDAYSRYRSAVPNLFPARARWAAAGPEAGRVWSRERWRDNGELGTALAVAGGLVLLALRPALPL